MSFVGSNILAGASGQGGATGYEIKRSLRFNSGDSAYLNRTPSSVGNRKTFTLSAWVKAPAIANTQQIILSSSSGSTPYTSIDFRDNNLRVIEWDGSNTTYQLKTNAVLRDVSAWYHVVFAVDTTQSTTADRVKIYVNGVQETSFATANYPSQNHDTHINNSTLHYIGSNAATSYNGFLNCYLADVHFIDGQALAPTDFGETDDNGVWQPKAYGGTYGTNGFHLDFTDNSSNAALGTDTSGNSNDFSVYNLNAGGSTPNYTSGLSYVGFNGTTTFGGDGPGGVGAFDSSEAYRLTGDTSSGSGQTAIYTWVPPGGSISASSFKLKFQYFGTNSFGTTSVALNGGSYYTQGGSTSVTTYDFSSLITGGQITEVKVKWVSNQSGIGAHSWYGMWIDNVLLVDADPLGNDSLVDHPTNGTQSDTGAGGEVVGNYATLNPLTGNTTLSNGNLDSTGKSGYNQCLSTIGMSSGKYYCEITIDNASGGTGVGIGTKAETGAFLGNTASGYLLYTNGTKRHTGVNVSYGNSYTTGDTIGIAFDADGGNLYFYKNGTIQASGVAAFTGLTSGPYFFAVDQYDTSNEIVANFGQRAFAYTAPSGYKALCTANLPEPTIKDGSKYFDAKIYSGTGGTQSISGFGFSPDLVWIKNRTNSVPACLFDTLRTAGVSLETNNADKDTNWSNRVNAFITDGFTTGNSNSTNGGSQDYVSWVWNGGGSTSTNTNGNIQSTLRASPASGFSIVKYTGVGGSPKSIGHGLNSAPGLVIVKRRDADDDWATYFLSHTTFFLNTSANTINSDSYHHGDYKPTSTLFSVGNDDAVNKIGGTYIAYCFASVEGYSKVATYMGNGDDDGRFVYTGFKPRFVLVKGFRDSNWGIWDTARDPFNVSGRRVQPHYNGPESSSDPNVYIDILSNGFKFKSDDHDMNESGTYYVYYAIAEHPFKTARAR